MSSMTVLTTGQDTVLPLDGDQVVQATSATLTATTTTYDGTTTQTFGDQLDGGAGYDVLALTGSGLPPFGGPGSKLVHRRSRDDGGVSERR